MTDRNYLIEEDHLDNQDGLSQTIEAPSVINRAVAEQQQSSLSTNGIETDPENKPIVYTSQISALLIIVNVTVGVGLLAMPHAIQEAGLVTSILIQIVFLATIITTCIMSTELTVKSNANSFHQMVQVHCHPIVYQITQAAILLLVFGTVVAYLVIIGDQSDRVFASLYGPTFCTTWYMNRRFIMASLTVFVIKPLCCAKTVDFLKYASFAGVASIGFILYVVISELIKQGKIAEDVNYVPKDITDIAIILPVFCFAYQCHLSWVPIAATMRKEQKYRSYLTISLAMIIATVIYASVSILALLTFGSKILNDLTESYPGKTWPIITTVGIVAFKCVVTMAPAFLPARISLVDILTRNFTWFANLSEPTKRISVTFVTLNVGLLLALFVPDILVAVNVLGFLAVIFIFTLPGLCYLNLVKENRLMKQQLAGVGSSIPNYSVKDKIKRLISIFFIIFGTVMSLVVLYKSIQGVLKNTSTPPLCHT